jgi:glycosyltransferase involved in cell wall biosynthesis
MRKTVILEAHNIKNPYIGFGVFNQGLINGLSHIDRSNLDLVLLSHKPSDLRASFGNSFKYRKIYSFNRYKNFRVAKKHDLWHSLNQNLKFEPKKVSNYLLTVHDVNFAEGTTRDDISSKQKKLFVEKLERSNAITYISKFAKEQAHRYFNIPSVPEYIVYNGNPIIELADTSLYKPTVPVDKPFLYSIGDFLEKKNFIAIVEMMNHIKDFNLIISGNYEKQYGEEVKKAIERNRLSDRVFLTGKVSDTGKQYFMKNCSAFLFPSIGEGFGLPPIEAMKFGKPIFLANRTSLPEIGGEYAFYWNEFDAAQMAEDFYSGMATYNSTPDFYIKKYIERADYFNWDNCARQYLDIYNNILQ